jgi:hypothetical protein
MTSLYDELAQFGFRSTNMGTRGKSRQKIKNPSSISHGVLRWVCNVGGIEEMSSIYDIGL